MCKGFAAFIDEPPVIKISGSIVKIIYGHAEMDRVMSARTLRRAVERGKRALERHATGEDNIIVDE